MVNNGRIYGSWLMVIIRIGFLIMGINGEQWQNLWVMAYGDYKSWRIDNGD
jgi:hypothetical protein